MTGANGGLQACKKMAPVKGPFSVRAFSSEVDTGSR
jgi:hypothetical protein